MQHNAADRENKFQFTPLREGRQGCGLMMYYRSNFNSRPCVRGDLFLFQYSVYTAHFNSRPCVRGDGNDACGGDVVEQISIHAPA